METNSYFYDNYKRHSKKKKAKRDKDIVKAQRIYKLELDQAGLNLPLQFGRKRKRGSSAPKGIMAVQADTATGYKVVPMGKDGVKYWDQRYRLFTKFDQGVVMDKEGWFSVTPEAISVHIAERCRCDVIVDPFAGCGGNVIQFAMTCHMVYAIDIDPLKLACARQNARVYGVEDRIEWILGDAKLILPKIQADVVFLSPPWGGPSYLSQKTFGLENMKIGQMNGFDLFHLARKTSLNVAYFLPRNTSVDQLKFLQADVEIENNIVNGKVKTMTGYYGEL